jgi:hypothetical protein
MNVYAQPPIESFPARCHDRCCAVEQGELCTDFLFHGDADQNRTHNHPEVFLAFSGADPFCLRLAELHQEEAIAESRRACSPP